MEALKHCITNAEKTIMKDPNKLRGKIWTAKNFCERKCDKIEQLQLKYDTFNLHKKIKELVSIQKPKTMWKNCSKKKES